MNESSCWVGNIWISTGIVIRNILLWSSLRMRSVSSDLFKSYALIILRKCKLQKLYNMCIVMIFSEPFVRYRLSLILFSHSRQDGLNKTIHLCESLVNTVSIWRHPTSIWRHPATTFVTSTINYTSQYCYVTSEVPSRVSRGRQFTRLQFIS